MSELASAVAEIADAMRARAEVARYIPEPARADPGRFGIAVIDAGGEVAAAAGRSRLSLSAQRRARSSSIAAP